ncbi:MAG: translation initiation factor IF-2 subunit alpha [Thermoproteales archaeon]|nr:translation initiation factor IF-2 subunit alpha [Thermoproteales archaeon]
MMRKRKRLPSYNELVIGTVEEIYDHGAFILLDEYGGLKAYIPLNEVSHSWFRGIREVLKKGQKRVFKVIRLDRKRGIVDVSLKRVSESERKQKLYEWKRLQRADKLLEIAAKKVGKSLEEAYKEAGWKLEDYYGEIFAGLEEAALRGDKALEEAGIKEPWKGVLTELAKAHIKFSIAKISGIFHLECYQSDGIERIKRILLSWRSVVKEDRNIKIRMYTLGSPKYKLDIESLDYKTAEGILKKILSTVQKEANNENCSIEFERLKR